MDLVAIQNLELQASTLSYIDTFWLLTLAAGAMFFLTFVLKKCYLAAARRSWPTNCFASVRLRPWNL